MILFKESHIPKTSGCWILVIRQFPTFRLRGLPFGPVDSSDKELQFHNLLSRASAPHVKGFLSTRGVKIASNMWATKKNPKTYRRSCVVKHWIIILGFEFPMIMILIGNIYPSCWTNFICACFAKNKQHSSNLMDVYLFVEEVCEVLTRKLENRWRWRRNCTWILCVFWYTLMGFPKVLTFRNWSSAWDAFPHPARGKHYRWTMEYGRVYIGVLVKSAWLDMPIFPSIYKHLETFATLKLVPNIPCIRNTELFVSKTGFF